MEAQVARPHLLDEEGYVQYWAAQFYLTPSKEKWDSVEMLRVAPFAEGFSKLALEKLLVKELGALVVSEDMLQRVNNQPTTLSYEDFLKVYEFGKYAHAKDWLKYFANNNQFVTREELHGYILRTTGADLKKPDQGIKFRVNVY